MNNFYEIIAVMVLLYIALYSIIDRICKCFERCVSTKSVSSAYSSITKVGEDIKLESKSVKKD